MDVYNIDGELVEWSKAPHWKCGVPQGTEGSNPSLSAIFILNKKSQSKAKSKFASKTCNLLFFLYSCCALYGKPQERVIFKGLPAAGADRLTAGKRPLVSNPSLSAIFFC